MDAPCTVAVYEQILRVPYCHSCTSNSHHHRVLLFFFFIAVLLCIFISEVILSQNLLKLYNIWPSGGRG